MWSCGCNSCSCGCSCGSSCGCSCGCGSNNGITTLPAFPSTPAFPGVPVFPDLSTAQFPVYVSYPSFFPSEGAVFDANVALFSRDNGSDSGCGCRG